MGRQNQEHLGVAKRQVVRRRVMRLEDHAEPAMSDAKTISPAFGLPESRVAPVSEGFKELFIVEHESGDMLDDTGNGGYTTWSTRIEAQDALDSMIDSHPEDGWKVIRFVRDSDVTLSQEDRI